TRDERLRVRRDGDAGGAHPGRLARVAPEGGMTGRLEGAAEDEGCRVGACLGRGLAETGHDAAAHAAGRARHDDLRHRRPVRYFARPYWRRTPRSFSRFASPMRHMGNRNSGSTIPAIAIASL